MGKIISYFGHMQRVLIVCEKRVAYVRHTRYRHGE